MNVFQVFYTHSRGGNLYCHWLYLCSRSSPLDVEGFWIELALTVVRLDRIWRLVSEMLLYLAALHHQVMCHDLLILRVFLLILSFSLYLLYWPVRQLNTCSSFCSALTATMNSRVKSAVYISWKSLFFCRDTLSDLFTASQFCVLVPSLSSSIALAVSFILIVYHSLPGKYMWCD